MVKIVTLTGSLTYACKYRISAVLCCYITDKLLYEHRLTYSGAAKQSDLSTLLVRAEQIDNLDSCLEKLCARRLLFKLRSLSVYGKILHIGRCRLIVYRLTKNIKNTSECILTYRNSYRRACSGYIHTANQSVSGTHGNTSYRIISQMLCDFDNQCISVFLRYPDSFIYLRKRSRSELYIKNRTDYLGDPSCFILCHCFISFMLDSAF